MNMPAVASKKARTIERDVVLNDERVWRFGFIFCVTGFSEFTAIQLRAETTNYPSKARLQVMRSHLG